MQAALHFMFLGFFLFVYLFCCTYEKVGLVAVWQAQGINFFDKELELE